MNNPSYKNLCGAGDRASNLISVSGTTDGSTANKIAFATNPFAAGDANNRIVRLSWSTYTNVTGLITTVNTPGGAGYIIVSNINWDGQSTGNLPTSTAMTVASGGAYLVDIALSNVSMGAGDAYNLLNGDSGSGDLNPNTIYFNTSSAGATITFDFGVFAGIPASKILTEIQWWGQSVSFGLWTIEASSDATTWDTLNASFTWGVTTNGVQAIPLAPAGGTWTKGYRYVRLRSIGGATNAGPYVYQFKFKIDDFVPSANVTAQRPCIQKQADLIKLAYLDELSGFSKDLSSPPSFIRFADAFDQGDWAALNGTATFDYSASRMGSKSIALATASKNGRLVKTLKYPLDITNSETIISYYLKTNGAGDNWYPGLTILAGESLSAIGGGNYVTLNYQSDLLSGITNAPHWPAKVNGVEWAVTGTVNLANIQILDIRVSDQQAGDITVVFDSWVTMDGRGSAQFSMRNDLNDINVTGALMDYVDALGLGISIQFGTSMPTDSATASMFLIRQTRGHQVFNYIENWAGQSADQDLPLSRFSRVGKFRWTKNYLQSIGIMPYNMGVSASGSGELYNPDLWAKLAADQQWHANALASGESSTYCNEHIVASADATDGTSQTALLAAITAAIANKTRFVLFSHLGTYTALAYWIGSTAAAAASAAHGGDAPPNGVTGIFDPAGALCTALKNGSAKWYSFDQFRNVNVASVGAFPDGATNIPSLINVSSGSGGIDGATHIPSLVGLR